VPNLAFGYEEAIGYCPDPEHVHDKDGPTTGVLLAKIAARAKADGKTLIDLLDDQARKYGLYQQRQLSVRLDSKAKILGLIEKLRNTPPNEVANAEVVEVVDFEVNPPDLSLKMNAIGLFLDDNTRILVRPSGTEPKVKFYIETITDVNSTASFADLTEARLFADKRLTDIVNDLDNYARSDA
jgi:phosphomannomutase